MTLKSGHIVATRRTLTHVRGMFAGPFLWADTLGVVLDISATGIVLVHFGAAGAVWVLPDELELAGVSIDAHEQRALEVENAQLKQQVDRLTNTIADLLKPTGARLAHAGSGNGRD